MYIPPVYIDILLISKIIPPAIVKINKKLALADFFPQQNALDRHCHCDYSFMEWA